MNDRELELFGALLLSRREELQALHTRAGSGTETVELDQSKVGRLSRMDALQMQQMNLASQRRIVREIAAIDSALKRIENGEYGFCSYCDEAINPHRLEVDPVALLCIDCASKQEQQQPANT